MKVWITKYAITRGIVEAESTPIEGDAVVAKIPDQWENYFRKPYWHETKEAAIAQAETMRQKKIKSLEREIEKIKKLTF